MSLLDKDFPSLAAMPPQLAAAKLRDVGEIESAEDLENASTFDQPEVSQDFGIFNRKRTLKPWEQTGTNIGYLPPGASVGDSLPIISARRVEADATLKGARLRIALDRFYVAQYPGSGEHHILLHFATQFQERGRTEPETLHFNTTCKVQDGQLADVLDYPIFVGFPAGNEGLTLEYTTISVDVTNKDNEKILNVLDSDVFKAGVQLVSTLQPMLAPFSAMAVGLAKLIFDRKKSINIGPFKMGLDFSTIPLHSHLATGSFIIMHLPEELQRTWNWNDWAYNIDSSLIVKKADPQQHIPYNYLILSITRCQEE